MNSSLNGMSKAPSLTIKKSGIGRKLNQITGSWGQGGMAGRGGGVVPEESGRHGNRAGHSLSRKSELAGSELSMWEDSSL